MIDAAWSINSSEAWEFLNRAREDFVSHPALVIAGHAIPESKPVSWSMLAVNLITAYGKEQMWHEATSLNDKLTALAEQYDEAPLREEQAKAAFNLITDYGNEQMWHCLLYTSPSPRDLSTSRMPSSA